ncbi:MAG: hypothetical protein ACJAY5_001659 [Actinomycetes bacterium]|jgi:hypothetical protein
MMIRTAAPLGSTSTPRTPSSIKAAQYFNIALALLAWFSLVLRFILSFQEGGLHAVFISLSYFTILSNILLGCVVTALAFNPRRDGPKFRWLRLGAVVQIAITGIIFVLVLAPLYTPETTPTGWQAFLNYSLHYIVPSMSVVGWLVFGPRRRITVGVVFSVLIIPAIWFIYTLIHGVIEPRAFSGASYPYPFINVDELGYLVVGVNTVVIAAFALVIGFIFMGLERLMSKAPIEEVRVVDIDEPPSATR